MSIKCSVFIATTLDGFIAREDGEIDWLMKANALVPSGEDGGYHSFISSVDALVMGRHSYEKVLSFDPWPYGQLPVIVLSSQSIAVPKHLAKTVSSSAEKPGILVNRLINEGFKHLYIDGGMTIQSFIAENLIHELTITVVPILLGSGRPLFGPLKREKALNHVETKNLGGGFVQMKYKMNALCI